MGPEVICTAGAMRLWSRAHRAAGRRISLVPTMGFLHDGHLSLVSAAVARSDVVVVSIYVNPAQFAAHEDFGTYPRDPEGDLAKLRALGVHAVFQPTHLYVQDGGGKSVHGHSDGSRHEGAGGSGEVKGGGDAEAGGGAGGCQLGASQPKSGVEDKGGVGGGGGAGDEPPHETYVTVESLQVGLCGVTRPHFFRGVATVVAKLFNIVEPDVAVFGKKDYQQWRIIRRMVRDLDFDVDIVGMPLAREADGLAMSSRNVRLTPEHRAAAVAISVALTAAAAVAAAAAAGRETVRSEVLTRRVCDAIAASGGRVDYVEVVDQRTLRPVAEVTPGRPVVIPVAAMYGEVRLLDNMEIGGEAL
eukprot:CAMPEP_0181374612 /NCGR_PEP_ID=MMETSP1106-20121128/16129_1 /TAXON_ID=81844 /ORGANISM="Mantoniella antarctica, Strain SL-175" /LENGTH=357 /DNA_ID=CAMNT_0023492637 /DNA_START=1 /DNA_END=1074 /DNA_ORIENTATION=-